MIEITKDNNEIIVHEIPIVQWFYSVAIGVIFFGLFFFGLLALTHILAIAVIVAAVVSISAFLIYLWDNPSTMVKVNKQGKIVSIRKKSLVGYKFDVYDFEEIRDLIYIDEIEMIPKQYRIILPLKNGRDIEISSQIKTNEREYFEAADLLNSYIFHSSKQISHKVTGWNTKKKDE